MSAAPLSAEQKLAALADVLEGARRTDEIKEAVRRVSCVRCGNKFTSDGAIANSKGTVYMRCQCGGTSAVRPAGVRSAWNGQV